MAFWAPDRLWRVPAPDCFATLRVPDLLGHTEQNEWNLADPADRRRAYEILIRRGLPQMMIRWLDGGFLVDLWDSPRPARPGPCTPGQPAIDGATRSHSSDVFSWHGSEEDPETADLARITWMEFLPKPPPPPPRRQRRTRFDPRPPPRS